MLLNIFSDRPPYPAFDVRRLSMKNSCSLINMPETTAALTIKVNAMGFCGSRTISNNFLSIIFLRLQAAGFMRRHSTPEITCRRMSPPPLGFARKKSYCCDSGPDAHCKEKHK